MKQSQEAALYLRSVCPLTTAFHGLEVSSAGLHSVETTFKCLFESYLRSDFMVVSVDPVQKQPCPATSLLPRCPCRPLSLIESEFCGIAQGLSDIDSMRNVGSFLPSLLVGFSTTNSRAREPTLSWNQLHLLTGARCQGDFSPAISSRGRLDLDHGTALRQSWHSECRPEMPANSLTLRLSEEVRGPVVWGPAKKMIVTVEK
jgi:hypothetical protein